MRVIVRCHYDSRFNGRAGRAISLGYNGNINVLLDGAVKPIPFNISELINEPKE